MSLHVHSEFSSLDGWSTCDEIAERMEQIGCPYCGLTDHGVVAGHIEFDKAMRSRGLKPVFGCELYHGVNFEDLKSGERDQAHLIALAMTDTGLRNLWRLVNATASRSHFHHVGRVTNDDLINHKEGIIFTSACPLGLVPKGLLRGDSTHLNWYLNNLGDNFRIELTTYPGDAEWRDNASDEAVTPQYINEMLLEAAEEKGVLCTYGDDGHYAFPNDFDYHNMYLASQTRQSIYTPIEDRTMYHPPGAVCIKDEGMVRDAFHYLDKGTVDELINNTNDIGEKANAHLPTAERPHLPMFIPAECPWIDQKDQEKTAKELFEDLVIDGIAWRYQEASNERFDEAVGKAEHEMNVLMEDGLEHYFLWAWEIVQFCELEDIDMGPGRGSSAGSIVAYALGITDVDPLHYDLFFERFWNKGRTDGFPDIDSDFARSKRPVIREFLINRLGEERVCSIGTIKRMKPIACIKKLREACDITVPEQEELKRIVEQTDDIEILGTDQIGWNPKLEPGKVIYVKECVGDQIEEWVGFNQKRKRYVKMCEHACSRNENYGIHPSGIVISDINLDAYAPAYLRGGKNEGIPATLFPMDIIEKLKLLKMDVLGLKTLDTLAEWKKLVEAKGVEVNWSGLDRDENIPSEMWDLLDEGFVSGIFQVETPGGKAITEKLKPRSVEDLGVLNALNRPGPQRDGIPNRYVARMEGRSEVTYPHPMLEEILEPTYGLFVYQEQIIRFMWALGYELGDADAVRKVLGKKQPEKLEEIFKGFNEWDQKGFLRIAMEKGFTEEAATDVWKTIEGFAKYSFNKAHAIAYGILGFRCLYAKYLYPHEFYVACIRTVEHQNRAKLTPQYIKESRRMRIPVLPPDIRFSDAQANVQGGRIYFGFSDIKGVATAGEYVVYLRDDLGFDVDSPQRLLEELDGFNDEQLVRKKELKEEGELPEGWRSPKQQLNESKIEKLRLAGAWDWQGTISLRDKQKAEQEYLNVILTDNTEEVIRNNMTSIKACDDFAEAAMRWDEKMHVLGIDGELDEEDLPIYIDYKLPGIVTNVKPTKVKKTGASMGIVTIEFERFELSFACFSNKWPKAKALFKPHQVGIFKIRHSGPSESRGESWHYEDGRLLR